MTPSMFEYVLQQLQKCKGQWPTVAQETEISKRTLEKIAAGEIVDPGVLKIERLNAYFRAQERTA
jgi:hypothetical protein